MLIVITYRGIASITLTAAVDDLTGVQVAQAIDAALHGQFSVPGADEIHAAYLSHPGASGWLSRLMPGDTIHAAGSVLRLTDLHDPHGHPVFEILEHHGPTGVLYVTASVAPPEDVAYAEDARDRLWTGRGAGIWTCLTDPAGRTAPVSWRQAWLDFGPMVPLRPVTVSHLCTRCGGWGGGGCPACTQATGWGPVEPRLPGRPVGGLWSCDPAGACVNPMV